MHEPTRQPEMVTLCGSMRFLAMMLRVAAQETGRGAIVLAPFAVVPPHEQGSEFKAMLDRLHRRKIDLADRVAVVSDESGYTGDSTRAEIAYARTLGVPVTFEQLPRTRLRPGPNSIDLGGDRE
jgi:hypothetical protein